MTQARDLMEEVAILLQDEAHTRWPLDELRLWLNAGLREIALHKPSATNQPIVFGLKAGTKQVIPEGATSLVSVVRNVRNLTSEPPIGRQAIKVVAREDLDAQVPDWHNPDRTDPTKAVQHVVFDSDDPTRFSVYPPNTGTGVIEAVVTRIPDMIERQKPSDKIHKYAIEIDIKPIYDNALVDYMLYRAYLKDQEGAANAARAIGHYQAFGNSLGVKLSMEIASNPNTR